MTYPWHRYSILVQYMRHADYTRLIGQTQSGKDIYASFDKTKHAAFSMADHIDAYDLHNQLATEARRRPETLHTQWAKVAQHHETEALKHADKALEQGA